MRERTRRGTRLRRTIVVLALGIAIGTMIVATPAMGHVGGTVSHLWGHLKPKADARYANAVAGTDKARDADKLDGIDSKAVGRVARNSIAATPLDNGSDGGYVSELSVSMTGPATPGLVLVQANLGAYTFSEANCPCQIEMQIRNVTAGTNGPTSFAWVAGTADEDGIGMGSGSVSAVFPLPAGATHQYDFQAVVDDANGSVNGYIDMWAEYVPFNASGGTTLARAAQHRAASGASPVAP